MDDKEAAAVLEAALAKYAFDEKEQEAIRSAIGVLGWTKLVAGAVERRKARRDKLLEE